MNWKKEFDEKFWSIFSDKKAMKELFSNLLKQERIKGIEQGQEVVTKDMIGWLETGLEVATYYLPRSKNSSDYRRMQAEMSVLQQLLDDLQVNGVRAYNPAQKKKLIKQIKETK